MHDEREEHKQENSNWSRKKSQIKIRKKRWCSMIAFDKTLYQRPNDTEINNSMSPFCLEQWVKPILHSMLKSCKLSDSKTSKPNKYKDVN